MTPVLSATSRVLRAAIDRTLPLLQQLDAAATMNRPAADKWSQREILGHLVDSAVNNIPRFVRLLASESGADGTVYAQTEWVRVQAYQQADWQQLIALWYSINMHIAFILDQVPATALERVMRFHGGREDATLHFLATDYLDHLEHHLAQIFK